MAGHIPWRVVVAVVWLLPAAVLDEECGCLLERGRGGPARHLRGDLGLVPLPLLLPDPHQRLKRLPLLPVVWRGFIGQVG